MELSGGTCSNSSVVIFSKKYSATVKNTKNGLIASVKKNNSIEFKNFLSKIPFLRIYGMMLEIIMLQWKAVIVAMLAMITLITLLSQLTGTSQAKGSSFIVEKWYPIYLIAILLVFSVIKFTEISRYHAAEHMVISTYMSKQDITIDNIKTHKREDESCGSIIVIFALLLMGLFYIIDISPAINILISLSIAYEMFLVRDGKIKKLLTPIYKVGLFIQVVALTNPPKEKHLITARDAMLKLIETEQLNETTVQTK